MSVTIDLWNTHKLAKEKTLMRVTCLHCDGQGMRDHPSIATGRLNHLLGDPIFHSLYMSGVFDVPCSECEGRKWVDLEVTQ